MNQAIILFDGVCNLCNGFVQFVIKRDVKNRFLFASLQSEEGKGLIRKEGDGREQIKTIVLIENGIFYKRSTAVLKICKHLAGSIKLVYVFTIIPAFIRDILYKIIARKRYAWFGKRNECMVPTPDLQKKFLSNEYQQENTRLRGQREPRTV